MTVGGMYYFPGLVLIRNNMLTTYYARGEFIDCLKTERLLLWMDDLFVYIGLQSVLTISMLSVFGLYSDITLFVSRKAWQNECLEQSF